MYNDQTAPTRSCPWCRGTGSQTAPHLAPMRWACPDCGGTGRQEKCPTCGEWVGPGHVCEVEDLVTDCAGKEE